MGITLRHSADWRFLRLQSGLSKWVTGSYRENLARSKYMDLYTFSIMEGAKSGSEYSLSTTNLQRSIAHS